MLKARLYEHEIQREKNKGNRLNHIGKVTNMILCFATVSIS